MGVEELYFNSGVYTQSLCAEQLLDVTPTVLFVISTNISLKPSFPSV